MNCKSHFRKSLVTIYNSRKKEKNRAKTYIASQENPQCAFFVLSCSAAGKPGETFSRRDGERRRFGGRAASARALEPFTVPACVGWCTRPYIFQFYESNDFLLEHKNGFPIWKAIFICLIGSVFTGRRLRCRRRRSLRLRRRRRSRLRRSRPC